MIVYSLRSLTDQVVGPRLPLPSPRVNQSENYSPYHYTDPQIPSKTQCILYGLHLSQIHHYFTTYPISKLHLFVIWIFLLSTFQVIIIFASGWHYFVDGLHDLTTVWGAFWWPLSVQEGLVSFSSV